MSHFAKIDENNLVVEVIVAEQDFIDTLDGVWVQTSYNTFGGKHYSPETGEEDDGAPLRKNFAGIGYEYDADRDAFIPPQPFSSWTLDEESCLWVSPTERPTDPADPDGNLLGNHYWDEDAYLETGEGWIFEPNCYGC